MILRDFENNEQRKRFETTRDGKTAFVNYTIHGNTYNLTHTEVPNDMHNEGIGTQLVKRTLDYIKERQMKVNPTCPFVQHVIDDNSSEYESMVE